MLIYEIRLKGRQKQGECSSILIMTFLIIVLSALSINLIPIVYVSAVKPLMSVANEKAISFIISAAVMLMLWQVYSCLSYGCDRFMLKRAENFTSGAGDIFYYFKPKNLFSLLTFTLRLGICKLMTLVLVLTPFFICGWGCYSLCMKGFSAAVCGIFAVFSAVFFFVGFSTYSRICDSLFLVRYLFIKGDYLDFRHLLSQSQQDMSKKSNRLRKLKGSFVGWFLLSLLVFPLPYVWCYYRQTKACFAAEN